MDELQVNLFANAIPATIFDMTVDGYSDFLVERRALIARKIRRYYEAL